MRDKSKNNFCFILYNYIHVKYIHVVETHKLKINQLLGIKEMKVCTYVNIQVAYLDHLNGGGMGFGQQYIPIVRDRIGRVGHVFEFCAGPGFIGFSLLAHNLCERLTLADVNPEAIAVCRETIRRNKLEARVSTYLSDGLDGIPDTERWDLVVGNPPHFFCTSMEEYATDIKGCDPNFEIHRRFYRGVRKFLTPSGSVLLQENGNGSTKSDFELMIAEGGLEIADVFKISPVHLYHYMDFARFARCLNPGMMKRYLKSAKRTRANIIQVTTPIYFIWSKQKSQ